MVAAASPSRGRGLTDPNKSLMAIAVETVPASPQRGQGIKRATLSPAAPASSLMV